MSLPEQRQALEMHFPHLDKGPSFRLQHDANFPHLYLATAKELESLKNTLTEILKPVRSGAVVILVFPHREGIYPIFSTVSIYPSPKHGAQRHMHTAYAVHRQSRIFEINRVIAGS